MKNSANFEPNLVSFVVKITYIMEKKIYIAPEIMLVELDADISLQLTSAPPEGPGESSLAPNYFNNDPYKTVHV
jgi:hypothetical protein